MDTDRESDRWDRKQGRRIRIGGGMMPDIGKKLIDIAVQQLAVDREKIVPGANFVDDLGADSLDIVELIMAIEEEFDLEIPDEDVERMATIKGAIDYLEERTAAVRG